MVTPINFIEYTPVASVNEKRRGMGDEGFPDDSEIIRTWKDVKYAMEKLDMTKQGVHRLLRRSPDDKRYLRGKVIGRKWFIDGNSIEKYLKTHGSKS